MSRVICAVHVKAVQPSNLLRLPPARTHGLALRLISGQQELPCECLFSASQCWHIDKYLVSFNFVHNTIITTMTGVYVLYTLLGSTLRRENSHLKARTCTNCLQPFPQGSLACLLTFHPYCRTFSKVRTCTYMSNSTCTDTYMNKGTCTDSFFS